MWCLIVSIPDLCIFSYFYYIVKMYIIYVQISGCSVKSLLIIRERHYKVISLQNQNKSTIGAHWNPYNLSVHLCTNCIQKKKSVKQTSQCITYIYFDKTMHAARSDGRSDNAIGSAVVQW